MNARIASLHCYPLKSAGGLELGRAQLTRAGIASDRRWMVVTPGGRFLTQRELPRLALLSTELGQAELILRGPASGEFRVPLGARGERVAVEIWKDRCPGLDEGEAAARWLEAALGRECRLVRFDPDHRRLSSHRWTGELDAENLFCDGFPLLVIGAASLADLNSRLGRSLPLNRFRANLVLEGIGPYQEDRIDELVGAGVRLKLVKPCTRCRITTTDQDTGEWDGEEPLKTLRSYRYDSKLRGVVFGQNAVVVEGESALLERGQLLEVRWKARAPSSVA